MKQRIGYTAALLALLVALTGCSIPHIRRIEPVPEPTGTELPETEPPETETPETETPETEMPETEAPEPEPVKELRGVTAGHPKYLFFFTYYYGLFLKLCP